MDTYIGGHVKAYYHDELNPQQTLEKLQKIYPDKGFTLSEIEKEYESIVSGISKFDLKAKDEEAMIGEEPSQKMLLAFKHQILNYCGTDIRLSLRKTCHALRNMVDNHHDKFPELDLLVSNCGVEIKNKTYTGHYQSLPQGCMISSIKDLNKQCKYDRNGNIWESAGLDLKALLNNSNITISKLNVLKGFSKNQHQYTMWLTRILQNAQPIVQKPKVKTLSIDFSDQEAFGLILDLINPEQLETIEITNAQSDIGLHFPELEYLRPILDKNFVNVRSFISDLRFQKQDIFDVLGLFDFARCAVSEELDVNDVLQLTDILKTRPTLDEVIIDTPAVHQQVTQFFMGVLAGFNFAINNFYLSYPKSKDQIHMRLDPQRITFRGPKYVERNPEVVVPVREVHACSCDIHN
ncbi:unnamed protein product [Caenorhabditis brenneri]